MMVVCCFLAAGIQAQRSEYTLEKGWKFMKGEQSGAQQLGYDDAAWQTVTVPHDWAVYGPFGGTNDLQHVAVTQNGETEASTKTGRTGGLPYVGVGWYRNTFQANPQKHVTLLFDGAMSEARVYVNGHEAIFWPYGYNSFYCDVTPYLNQNGTDNLLAVRLENLPLSSRWYPGAGLYRNVHVIQTEDVHVPVWGTQVITPHVEQAYATVKLLTTMEQVGDAVVRIRTRILSPSGREVAVKDNTQSMLQRTVFVNNLTVEQPELWSP